jgi:TRAP-type C4-dicarboxylate transport system permease small subunit
MQSNLLASIRKGLHSVIMVFTWIGAAALIILVLTTFANVVGRYLLRMPLTGAVEVSQLFLVVTVFFGVAYTEVRKQHVTFNEVVAFFPRRLRAITIGAMYFLVGVYALVMSWQETLLALSYMIPNVRVTDVLKIPIAPAMFVIAIGSLLWGIELMLNALSPLAAAEHEDIIKQEGITEDEVRQTDG